MSLMVSVCCATYNHEAYIAQTLDSILGQKTDFDIEILINDDASTDQTPTIIRDYQRRYPDIVKPIFQTENQYRMGVSIDPTFNYPRAKGKYIALCEGDDWWIDLLKLQKQVDAMEKNPRATFCFTNAMIHDQSLTRADRAFFPYRECEKKYDWTVSKNVTLGMQCKINFAPTASFLFPRDILKKLPKSYEEHYCAHGDLKLRMFMTGAGCAIYLPDKTCVYRENVVGSAMHTWSRDDSVRASARAKSIMKMLHDVDVFSKYKYKKEIQKFRDWYAYVMLFNAPTMQVLENCDARRVYDQLPLSKKIRLRIKHIIKKQKA